MVCPVGHPGIWLCGKRMEPGDPGRALRRHGSTWAGRAASLGSMKTGPRAVTAAIAASSALAALGVLALAACGAFAGEDASGGSPEAGGASDATSDGGSGAASDGAASDGASPDSAAPDSGSCVLATVPASAVSATTLQFGAFSAAGTTPTSWKSIGYDRDGRCTTATSTDVCKRVGNALPSAQVDGNGGIDNAWGATVSSILKTFDSSDPAGYLQTDASGTGTLYLTLKANASLEVPIVLAKVQQSGTTATLSAIVPLNALLAALPHYGGRFDPTLCSGATIQSVEAQITQAADSLANGTQAPDLDCNAISIGATLTAVTTIGSVTLPDAGPSPCP